MHSTLPPHQYALIAALGATTGPAAIEDLAAQSGVDQALLTAAAVELAGAGYVALEELGYTELKLGEAGEALQRGETELPERVLARVVRERGGSAGLKDLAADQALKAAQVEAGRFAKNLAGWGWATFEKGQLTLSAEAQAHEPPACAAEQLLTRVHVNGGTLELAAGEEGAYAEGLAQLKGRKELLTARERKRRLVRLEPDGLELAYALAKGEVTELIEANELTPEMLLDGGWRGVRFRSYDVTLAAEQLAPGKAHPLARVVEETRLAFLALGFTEANCPMAELAFWDFDALFQPQDHPAREMQDTFYLAEPARYPLPDRADWVEAVRRTHEDGGDTGSRGWRYHWSPERAAQVVLRTHMTASSIRAIARNPHPPQKVFSIGKVFRRETVDFKHLPEFFQVDGIIIDEQATLAALLGTLTKFLERMGLPEVRFKPDFFPYTEPSVGVEARYQGQWLELAGAGIFRPETTRPFGCTTPVLAWGFGLERLAMARYGITSIKDLYQADLGWLKRAALEA